MSLLDTLPEQSDDALRAQAIAALREVGLPTKKTEAWRFSHPVTYGVTSRSATATIR